MLPYILRRLLLMIPTLVGIMTLNFLIVQAAQRRLMLSSIPVFSHGIVNQYAVQSTP